MDEQMIADIADALAKLPCRDTKGVSVGFHDLDIMRRREAARAAHSVMAGKVAELEEIARTANELVNGGGLRTVAYADTPKLCVVEKADKSDPHYRLCTLLERAALAPHPKGME